ncbi:MAG TPA: aminotransferase class V-fold PLP-dependent enzyme [Acidimicrobiales bacterium]|nr:aminotransferase class V-fold PLP-dependent enzyme [Acidimicrobiales bacterium]
MKLDGLASPEVIHLEAASAALVSQATLDAQVAHLRREAAVGPSVAAAEVADVVAGLRDGLGALLGLRGDQVALIENATRGMASVLDAFPFRPGARVGVLRSEYGSTRMNLEAAAARGELVVVEVDTVDQAGDCDLMVASPVPSHRGVLQSVQSDVPVVLDVAQAAGHVAVHGLRAVAWVGTSRKWLRGPRGVGLVAVSDEWADRLAPRFPDLDSASWETGFAPGAARFAKYEATYAGQVGLANAVAELHAAGVEYVTGEISALGRRARARIAEVAEVHEPLDSPTGIVTFTVPGREPADVRRELRAAGVVVSLIPSSRAPRDMEGPLLRASFHTYNDDSDVEALVAALAQTNAV